MRISVIAVALASFVCGCSETAVETRKTSNPAISVDLLFEHQGVKIYRFHDGDRTLYYADARGKTAWEVSKGKHGTDRYQVETVEGDDDER